MCIPCIYICTPDSYIQFVTYHIHTCAQYPYKYSAHLIKTSTPLFGPFPIWGRCIKFSFSMFSGLVYFLSNSYLFVNHRSTTVLVFTSIFRVHITTSSVFLSICRNRLSLASIISSLTFAAPALALISSVTIRSFHMNSTRGLRVTNLD